MCVSFLVCGKEGRLWKRRYRLGLCTTSVLAFGKPMRSGDFREKTCFDAGKIGFCHCAAVFQTQVLKLCTELDLSLLYILILETYSRFEPKKYLPSARRLLSAALLERWPQVYRVKITFNHNKKIDEMRCKLDSAENLRSLEIPNPRYFCFCAMLLCSLPPNL